MSSAQMSFWDNETSSTGSPIFLPAFLPARHFLPLLSAPSGFHDWGLVTCAHCYQISTRTHVNVSINRAADFTRIELVATFTHIFTHVRVYYIEHWWGQQLIFYVLLPIFSIFSPRVHSLLIMLSVVSPCIADRLVSLTIQMTFTKPRPMKNRDKDTVTEEKKSER